MQDYYLHRGEWGDLRCPTCKHDYEGSPAVKLAEEALVKVGERGRQNDQYVLALHILAAKHTSIGNEHKALELYEEALALAVLPAASVPPAEPPRPGGAQFAYQPGPPAW